jgi:hypothetical protein
MMIFLIIKVALVFLGSMRIKLNLRGSSSFLGYEAKTKLVLRFVACKNVFKTYHIIVTWI